MIRARIKDQIEKKIYPMPQWKTSGGVPGATRESKGGGEGKEGKEGKEAG